ncbi:MAG: hypothetical protein HRT77_14905 [Halioglobus sp.]|nr:hypothetical protein [Halioglobus sp.]
MITRHARASRALRHWFFALVVALVTALPVGFFIGEYTAFTKVESSIAGYVSRIAELQGALDVALDELAVQRTHSEVDGRALAMLREQMASERERMAELEESMGLFRSMLSSGNTKGLYLHKPELVPGGAPRRIAFRIIVQQKERDFDTVEGDLSVEVHGRRNNEDTGYSMSELSEVFKDGAAALHFRYFQSIEGEMLVPAGFVPTEIVLVARTRKPVKTQVRAVYPWELQERLINVGE